MVSLFCGLLSFGCCELYLCAFFHLSLSFFLSFFLSFIYTQYTTTTTEYVKDKMRANMLYTNLEAPLKVYHQSPKRIIEIESIKSDNSHNSNSLSLSSPVCVCVCVWLRLSLQPRELPRRKTRKDNCKFLY